MFSAHKKKKPTQSSAINVNDSSRSQQTDTCLKRCRFIPRWSVRTFSPLWPQHHFQECEQSIQGDVHIIFCCSFILHVSVIKEEPKAAKTSQRVNLQQRMYKKKSEKLLVLLRRWSSILALVFFFFFSRSFDFFFILRFLSFLQTCISDGTDFIYLLLFFWGGAQSLSFFI